MDATYYFHSNERKYDHADANCRFWSGGSYISHVHEDYYEILFPNFTPFVNIVENEAHLLSPREVVIIPPGLTHSIQTIKKVAPHYNLAIWQKYFESKINSKKLLSDFFKKQKPYYLTLGEHAFGVIISLFQSIDNDNCNELFSLIVETILSLIVFYCERKEIIENKAEMAAVSYCQDAITKIENGYYLTGNVTEIYRCYPISHTTFGKEFKKLTNSTLIDFISRQRVIFAKKLIISTDLSVLDISNMVGYESVSHFIRKFKNEFGISPLQYRKKHQLGTEFQKKCHIKESPLADAEK